MGMIRWLRRLTLLGLGLYVLALAVTIASSRLIDGPTTDTRADVIVVLGAGLNDEGGPGWLSRRRVDHAVELWRQGMAPRLVMAGGPMLPGASVTVGGAMADYAVTLGVPPDAIVRESRSFSTVQNALFSLEELGDVPDSAILVTTPFHIGRSWVTLKWAGFSTVIPAPTEPMRPTPGRRKVYLMEALKWNVNVVRMSAWPLVRLLPLDEETKLRFLA